LENNGGFSSIRSPYNPIDLSSSDGLLIRILGDGQIYRLRIWTTDTGRDIAYNSFFETQQGQWTTVYIPFETMVPTFRGFRTNSGPLDSANVSSIGFMLSDKQPGEFSLLVDWIRAVAEEEIFPEGIPKSE
jgi:monofunctional biosynthetic peptidoglycan transglycosylase